MHLTTDNAQAYTKLLHPDDATKARDVALDICEQLRSGQRDGQHTMLIGDEEGQAKTALHIRSFQPQQWYMDMPNGQDMDTNRDAEALGVLLMAFLHQNKAQIVYTRTINPDPRPAWTKTLQEKGFAHTNSRIEYKTKLDTLPDETGTPLTWRTMPEVGEAETARIFEESARGAPDWDEEHDDPAILIPGYLKESGLTSDPSCVQVAYLDEQPIGFVIAQVEQSTGWSRLTYMGVVESQRGKKLGKWIHRRGLVLLRQQGGIEYHGGTDMTNLAMRRLFEQQRCQEFRRLHEWCWKTSHDAT